MQIERRIIESSLLAKGFVRDLKAHHHRYFCHHYEGKETGITTYTSHGSRYKTYHSPLLGRMKKELKLDKISEVADLLTCPMNGDGYNQILKEKGVLESE